MDVGSVSTGIALANLSTDVSVAVLSKSLDTIDDLSNGMQKILESSVMPHLGQNIDFSV